MIGRLLACAGVCIAMTGVSLAAELAPIDAHGIRLASFDGIVYYTVEQDGYRVVATLAAGPEALPIRFVATLGPGQRMLISVPRSASEPAIEVEIRRNGDTLVVGEPDSGATADLMRQTATRAPPHR